MNKEEKELIDALVAQINEQQAIEIQIRIDSERRTFLISQLQAAVERSAVSVTTEEFSRMLSELDGRLFPKE